MGVNERDQSAMVYLVERLRAETRGANEWHRPGIEAVVARLAGHSLHSALERVVRHAADPEARTPAAIERPFLPPPPGPQPAFPPKVDEVCVRHGGHKGSCSGCAADRAAGEKAREERRQRRSEKYQDRAAELRQIKADALPPRCAHGVIASLCVEHRSTPVEEPPSTGSNERTPA